MSEYITKKFKLPHGTLLVDIFHLYKVRVISNPQFENKYQVIIYTTYPHTFTNQTFEVLSNGEYTGRLITYTAYPSSGYKIHYIVHRINRKWNGRFIGFITSHDIDQPDLFSYYVDHAKEGEDIELG
jgi:hypothetical protein